MEKIVKKFDVAVIGGGPAGIMAAGRAAEKGAKVVLIEKNQSLGKKLLMTGNGRCNLTQSGTERKQFVEQFGRQGKFLFPALSAFGPEEVRKFFRERGVETKVEKYGKVFPVSDQASDVLAVLSEYLRSGQVTILTGKKVNGFVFENNKITGVKMEDETILADKYILCTGGKSYPNTGSTGDGYRWAKELGHSIVIPKPAIVPVVTEEVWVKNLQGITLENIRLSLLQDEKKAQAFDGDLIFTHFGVSGPLILNLAKNIGAMLETGKVTLKINIFPDYAVSEFDKKLQSDFDENNKKQLKNFLPEIIPQRLADEIVRLAGIEPGKQISQINRLERKKLLEHLTALQLTVTSIFGFERAMVTSGGVTLKEIDPKTLKSKIIENLYFAGEVLDLDGPTGGYNLQVCWSTGYLAGTSVSKTI